MSWLILVALVAVFVGERVLNGPWRVGTTGAGVGLLALALILRGLRVRRTDADKRPVERLLLGLQGVAAAGVGCALLLSASPWVPRASTAAAVLTAAVPALLLCAALPTLLVELSHAPMRLSPKLEMGRVKEALWSGLGLSFVAIFAFCAYGVASGKDRKVDLSYFRSATPGQATLQVARALSEPVTVTTFFPPANEVAEEVHEYLSSLAAQTPRLQVERLDVAVDPQKARELGVSQNGAVVLKRGGQKEQLSLGIDLERAKGGLRTLDADFQKRLLSISKGKRVLYFTEGHGERGGDRLASDPRTSLQLFRRLLESQNLEVRQLGAAAGLANQVPADAAAVVVLGPSHPLLPEEVSALDAYVKAGGRALIALDPRPEVDVSGLLAPLGLKFLPTVLANDQVYLAVSHRSSDRSALATATFSSHPSVTTLSQLGRRAPLLLLEAGALETLSAIPGASVDVTVKAHGKTFADANGNFEWDAPGESRREWPLAAAVKVKSNGPNEGRAVVVADSDLFSDAVLPNEGNTYFALDGVKWLLGDEALTGTVVSEEDKPIQHTQKQNAAWFYATLFLLPALVLGAGALRTRRQR